MRQRWPALDLDLAFLRSHTSLRNWEDLVLRRGWSSQKWRHHTTPARERALVADGPEAEERGVPR
ncbi:MAG: hypothetical protein Q8K58_12095 [Acidimicrobiales bacterium]|nr:hypothetical protein [Acidimicrobiales bacterium]